MNNDKKPRVLIISAVVPVEGSGGGCLAMKRHFVDRNDFEIAVASQHERDLGEIPFQILRRSRVAHRLRRSHFARAFENLEQWINWWVLPSELVQFVNDFQPNLIFSVVDDWHMGLAWQLSRKLNIPLAVNFQDLFALSNFVPASRRPYRVVQHRSLAKYRMLNRKAEAVFHTSQGMQDWFAPEQRGQVLYPIGYETEVSEPGVPPQGTVKLVYAGNCYGAYGRMLLQLAHECDQADSLVRLQIYSQGNDWCEADLKRFSAAGIYLGSLPFAELQIKLSEADAFLTVMSFEEEERSFVKTSFTTKWLDYAPHAKPIFVWGPEYCSATKFARAFDAGMTITEPTAQLLVKTIEHSASSSETWCRLAAGAQRVAADELNASRIHAKLRSGLEAIA